MYKVEIFDRTKTRMGWRDMKRNSWIAGTLAPCEAALEGTKFCCQICLTFEQKKMFLMLLKAEHLGIDWLNVTRNGKGWKCVNGRKVKINSWRRRLRRNISALLINQDFLENWLNYVYLVGTKVLFVFSLSKRSNNSDVPFAMVSCGKLYLHWLHVLIFPAPLGTAVGFTDFLQTWRKATSHLKVIEYQSSSLEKYKHSDIL